MENSTETKSLIAEYLGGTQGASDRTETQLNVTLDQRCPLCQGDIFDNKEEKKITRPIMHSQALDSVVHQGCFMIYRPEQTIGCLFNIPCYSIGDTISATPVLRELRRLHPKMKITVSTFFPELFKYNPHVSQILDRNEHINEEFVEAHHFAVNAFDTSTYHHFAMHAVEMTSLCALHRPLLPKDWGYEVNYASSNKDRALEVLRNHGINPERDQLIMVHPHGTEWPTRDWGRHHMQELTLRLAHRYPGHKLVSIGGKRSEAKDHDMKNYVPLPKEVNAVDLYGELSLLDTIALLDLPAAKLLITPDTGTLHLGAASNPDLPIVGIFTLVRSEYRTPVRRGILGHRFIGVDAESGCNCTVDNRPLTSDINLRACPKKTFLSRLLACEKMPKEESLVGLGNVFPDVNWTDQDLKIQIANEALKYPDENLPCFPSVGRVLNAVGMFLDTQMRLSR